MWQAKDISEIEKNFRTNKDYGITNEEAKSVIYIKTCPTCSVRRIFLCSIS